MFYIVICIYIYIYTCIYMQNGSQWHNSKGQAKTSLEKYCKFVWERELETKQNCNILTPTLMAVSIVSFSFSRAAQPEAQGPSSLLNDGFLYCILSATGLQNSIGGSEGPFRPGVVFPTTSCLRHLWSPTHQGLQGPPPLGFLYHILSATSLDPNSIGGPKSPFGLVWFSLSHLASNSIRSLTVWLLVLTELYNSSTPTQSPTQSLEWHVWSSSSGNNCHAVQRSLSSGASIYECIMGFTLSHFISQIRPRNLFRLLVIEMCHFLPAHHFGMACLAGSKVKIQQMVLVVGWLLSWKWTW